MISVEKHNYTDSFSVIDLYLKQETPKPFDPAEAASANGQSIEESNEDCQIMLSYRIADCGAASLGQGGDGTVLTIAKYLEESGYTGRYCGISPVLM